MKSDDLSYISYSDIESSIWDKHVLEFNGDINYHSWMINYNMIYNKHTNIKNFSGYIVDQENKVLALVPLYIEKIDSDFQFSMGQNMIHAPLISKKLAQKEKITIYNFINTLIDKLAQGHQCKLARFQNTAFNTQDINYFSLLGYADTIDSPDWYIFKCPFAYILDLKEDLISLRSNIRKSFKSLINKTEKNSNFILLDKNNPNREIFDKYVQTHYEIKGQTRSLEAFEEDYNAICDGLESILICEKDDLFVGVVVLYTFNKKAIYNSAMQRYDIENLYPNHYLMWKSIEYLCEEDFEFFLIGEQIVDNSNYKISDKEKNLSFFKQAWGGELYPWMKSQKVYSE